MSWQQSETDSLTDVLSSVRTLSKEDDTTMRTDRGPSALNQALLESGARKLLRRQMAYVTLSYMLPNRCSCKAGAVRQADCCTPHLST